MRPWLVGIGAVLAVLAAGTIALVILLPPASQTTVGSVSYSVNPGASAEIPVWMTNSSSASLTLRWSGNGALNVTLYHPVDCLTFPRCPRGAALEAWGTTQNGKWSTAGSLQFPYLLVVTRNGSTAATFSAALSETYSVGGIELPALTLIFILGSAAILAIIGGIAIFLGLFLRPGVYDGPAPVRSRSAEDVEELANGPFGRR